MKISCLCSNTPKIMNRNEREAEYTCSKCGNSILFVTVEDIVEPLLEKAAILRIQRIKSPIQIEKS